MTLLLADKCPTPQMRTQYCVCYWVPQSIDQKWKENKNLSVMSAEVISTELPAEKHLEH